MIENNLIHHVKYSEGLSTSSISAIGFESLGMKGKSK